MDVQNLSTEIVYVVQGYHKEHVTYLQRAVFAEAENRDLKEKLHQEQLNSASTIQCLNDEIANLQARLEELQNRSSSTEENTP